MSTKILISHEDLTEEVIDFNADFGTPDMQACAELETRFPEAAEKGEIYSDGRRWYTDGAEATWYESDDQN